jgi:glycosyltransferase involved in cell wall biosynthesis
MSVKILGYHHHSTFSINKNGDYVIIKLHGVFLEELSTHYDELILFLYQNPISNSNNEDYVIKKDNIKVVSLGVKQNLIYRTLFGFKYSNIIKNIYFDKIIVRSPTPLLPFIVSSLGEKNITIPLVVGDYVDDIKSVTGNILKKFAVKTWIYINQYFYLKSFKNLKLVLFNNAYLKSKFEKHCQHTELISTSLVSKDYIVEVDECKKLQKGHLKIIYVGRLDLSKGLIELIEGVKLLESNNVNFNLEIIGWDDSKGNETTQLIKDKIKALQLNDKVILSGKISHGKELMNKYKEADIFYIGSKYSEGFPRVIWEALGSGCSVICSKVGGIPMFVSENEVYFLNEISENEIFKKIMEIYLEPQIALKKSLNGIELVKNFTIENSIKKIVNHIEKSS